MRPYDAVYRFDDEFYHALYNQYFVSLREHTQDVYLRINHEKLELEMELSEVILQVNAENRDLENQLVQQQAELIAVRGEALGYARELEALKSSGRSAAYFNGIFEGIRESIRYEEGENRIFFTFPDVPEAAELDVTLTSSCEDGRTETVLRCDGSGEFSAEPGGKYSVAIAEGTAVITLHIAAGSADGLCEVTFDLMDWVN